MDDPGDTRLIRFLTLLAWLTPVPLVVLVTGLAGLHEKRYDILWFGMAGLLAGPGLMGAIWLLGKLAQLHRAILLVVFGPGLMLTNLALVPLLAYNGGLATAFFGVFFFPLGIVLGIGTLFSVVTVFGRSLAFPFARGALGYQRGVVIGTEREPRLWVLVREVA